MCEMFAAQNPENYENRSRSVRIGGVVRSIQLENCFWRLLEEIAAEQGMSVSAFITTLWDEMCELRGEVPNFTSALRCSCLIYLAARGGDAEAAMKTALRA